MLRICSKILEVGMRLLHILPSTTSSRWKSTRSCHPQILVIFWVGWCKKKGKRYVVVVYGILSHLFGKAGHWLMHWRLSVLEYETNGSSLLLGGQLNQSFTQAFNLSRGIFHILIRTSPTSSQVYYFSFFCLVWGSKLSKLSKLSRLLEILHSIS